MSVLNFPNPARRAKLFQAHQLRQQGLTLRQIAKIMGCAHSTVAAYLEEFEFFRADLLHELAADQLVCHMIQLADIGDEHHGQRLATVRELRLLLGSVAQIRRDEDDRTRELTQAGVGVDRYGHRLLVPDRTYPPTPEELAKIERTGRSPVQTELDPDQPLTYAPVPDSIEGPLDSPDASAEPSRTESNKPEQESAPNSAQDAKSSNPEHNSLQRAIDKVDRQLEEVLRHRNWLKDYPSNNPYHPQREKALRLVEKKQALLAQIQEINTGSEAPDAA